MLYTVFTISLLFLAKKNYIFSLFILPFLPLNMETIGRRGRTLFTVTPTILPELVNIIWILGLFIVLVGEQGFDWDKRLKYGAVLTFFLNWIGIYADFYLGFNRPTTPFDDVSGRYLSPFLICFLPMAQSWNWHYGIKLTHKVISRVAIVVTIGILLLYLVTCYYRGYVIYVSPTWATK